MEASIYIRKIALPDIQAFAKNFGNEFTSGEEIIEGVFVELILSHPSESTIIPLAHAIGEIEGRAEERNLRKQKKE